MDSGSILTVEAAAARSISVRPPDPAPIVEGRGGVCMVFQQIEAALLNLADSGEKTAGHLSVEMTPAAPIRHSGRRWKDLHQVVRASNPGRIRITVRLTRPDGG